jgi:Asp-tRNA(Asn)/Glu-tRNA(Gln) amidotransferase A subunit family amidase
VSEPHWLTAVEAAKAIAARKLSPVELMTALLERIGRLDPKLNVFIRLDDRDDHFEPPPRRLHVITCADERPGQQPSAGELAVVARPLAQPGSVDRPGLALQY